MNTEDTAESEKKKRSHGFRMTLPRRVILGCLKDNKNYMTADDIFVAIHLEHPGIGIATIYRTLNLLEEHELISKVNVGDGKSRFAYTDQDVSSVNYHQLICKRCFKIIKFNDFTSKEICNMRDCQKKYSELYNFHIENHVVQYYGICEDCMKAEEEKY